MTLTQYREAAMARFNELGLPDRKNEAWRFNDLRVLTPERMRPADAAGLADPAPHRVAGATHLIVVANGRVRPDLSAIGELPDGARLGPVTDLDLTDTADAQGAQPFASLNAALFTGGFALTLAQGVAVPGPIEVLYLNDTSGSCHVRNVVRAAAGSSAVITETYASAGDGWTNAVTTIDAGADARLRHVKVQAEARDAIHIALTRVRLDAAAQYDAFVLVTGARLSRQDIQVAMAGPAAKLTLNGAWLLRGEQEATLAPAVDHQARDGETQELLKGVLAGNAHGVFLGSVLVREGADGTNARQLNRNLLTSPTARIDTKPELTIHADEVKCGHGATVGDLDEAALFYLVSRGIPPDAARHMLIESFAAEALDAAALPDAIDAHVRRYIDTWLGDVS